MTVMKLKSKDKQGLYMLFLAALLGIFFTPKEIDKKLMKLLQRFNTENFLNSVSKLKVSQLEKITECKEAIK